jgi:hypothetical protein
MHIFPEICMPHAMHIQHSGGREVLHSAYSTVAHFGISPASVDDVTQNPAKTALVGSLPIQAPGRCSNPARPRSECSEFSVEKSAHG